MRKVADERGLRKGNAKGEKVGFFSQHTKEAEGPCGFARSGVAQAFPPADPSCLSARESTPSTFGLLYESHDKIFCLYESRDGHLTAVDARRFV